WGGAERGRAAPGAQLRVAQLRLTAGSGGATQEADRFSDQGTVAHYSVFREQTPVASEQVSGRRSDAVACRLAGFSLAHLPPTWRFHMARKTIVVSDLS